MQFLAGEERIDLKLVVDLWTFEVNQKFSTFLWSEDYVPPNVFGINLPYFIMNNKYIYTHLVTLIINVSHMKTIIIHNANACLPT